MDEHTLEFDLLSLDGDEPEFFDLLELGPGHSFRDLHRMSVNDTHDNTEEKKVLICQEREEVDDSHWDQVMMFLRDVQSRHCYAKPDFRMAHSPTAMFSRRRYQEARDGGYVDTFDAWRSAFNHCEFTPFIHEQPGMLLHYRTELDLLFSPFGIKYFDYHEHKDIRPTANLRTRPVCCDEGHRSLCWVDINLTYHRPIYNANQGMPICINAPVKGFQVHSLTQHPVYRIREMFHSGVSMNGGKAMLADIDAFAINELKFAVHVLRKISSYNPLWCHIFSYLNPHEKMIFSSMMFDADDTDVYHRDCCLWMYGFSPSCHRYSLYDGHIEIAPTTVPSLRMMMTRRRHSPCQQLMKYAGGYDLVNTINRHAVRVKVMEEWASVLFRIVLSLIHI